MWSQLIVSIIFIKYCRRLVRDYVLLQGPREFLQFKWNNNNEKTEMEFKLWESKKNVLIIQQKVQGEN